VVGAEPLQGALDRDADVRRAAVEDAGAATGVRDEAELRRQHNLIAAALDGLADQFLIDVGAVDLGGVEVGDAQVQRPVDGANRLGVAACPDVVVAGHRHGAESDAGDVESADRDVLHGDVAPFSECGRALLMMAIPRPKLRPPEWAASAGDVKEIRRGPGRRWVGCGCRPHGWRCPSNRTRTVKRSSGTRRGTMRMRHPSPAARAIRNSPAPPTTAPMARATRSPAGARRSTVMAAATTAIARRSMTPMTRRIAIGPAQQ
jgi:hypothetical protein